MSIAANVLHTWLPAAHQLPGWSPGVPAQIGAGSVADRTVVLSRCSLACNGHEAGCGRSPGSGGTGTVALGSAAISYGHLRDVLLAWQYNTLAATVGPLVLDGLMVISGFALLAMSATRSNGIGDVERMAGRPIPQG